MSFKEIFKKDKSEKNMSGVSTEGTTGKVNINDLINRVKKERTKEKTEIVITLSLAFAFVIILGILVSI